MVINLKSVVLVVVISFSLHSVCMHIQRAHAPSHQRHQRSYSAPSMYESSKQEIFHPDRYSYSSQTTSVTSPPISTPSTALVLSTTSTVSPTSLTTHLTNAHNHKWYTGLFFGALAWTVILMQHKFAMPPGDDWWGK